MERKESRLTMNVKRRVLLVLIIAAYAFIWGHSMMPRTVSAAESGAVLDWLKDFFTRIGVSADLTDHIVRKMAHLTEYFVIGILWSLYLVRKKHMVFYVCIVIVCTSFIDETIQIFSSRGPAIQDMWIDLLGASVAAVLVWIVKIIANRDKGAKYE